MHSLHTSNAAHAASLSVVEKTDDLISALKLVRSTFAAGNVAANAPAATDREPTSDGQAAPGLLSLIVQYRGAKVQFGDRAPAVGDPPDSLAAETYEPPMEAIRNWNGPAENERTARAALKLGLEEFEMGDHETAFPLIKAANAFFVRDLAGISRQSPRREDIWQIDDCVTQVDGILCLALKTLSIVADGLAGNPLIHDVSALERALQLGRDRLEFASDRLGEISIGISRENVGRG